MYIHMDVRIYIYICIGYTLEVPRKLIGMNLFQTHIYIYMYICIYVYMYIYIYMHQIMLMATFFVCLTAAMFETLRVSGRWNIYINLSLNHIDIEPPKNGDFSRKMWPQEIKKVAMHVVSPSETPTMGQPAQWCQWSLMNLSSPKDGFGWLWEILCAIFHHGSTEMAQVLV